MTKTRRDPTICRRPFGDLPAPQQAGILSGDPAFQEFAGIRTLGQHGTNLTATATGEFIRQNCDIASRRELATNPDARAKFDALRTDFDAWRGRIAQQR